MSAVYVTPRYVDGYIPDISTVDAVLKSGTIGLRVTVTGVVKVDVLNGASGLVIPVTIDNDLWLPITKLYKTGTTATGIVAFV